MMKIQVVILAKEYTAELMQVFSTALLITCTNIFTYQLNKHSVNSRRGPISFTAQEENRNFIDCTVRTDLSTTSGLKKTPEIYWISAVHGSTKSTGLPIVFFSGKVHIYHIYHTQ